MVLGIKCIIVPPAKRPDQTRTVGRQINWRKGVVTHWFAGLICRSIDRCQKCHNVARECVKITYMSYISYGRKTFCSQVSYVTVFLDSCSQSDCLKWFRILNLKNCQKQAIIMFSKQVREVDQTSYPDSITGALLATATWCVPSPPAITWTETRTSRTEIHDFYLLQPADCVS